jgi:hypothetical protein
VSKLSGKVSVHDQAILIRGSSRRAARAGASLRAGLGYSWPSISRQLARNAAPISARVIDDGLGLSCLRGGELPLAA